MKAACHCGVVRFEIAEAPSWVLDCNCTLCRRYGALWSYYYGADQAKLLMKPRPDTTAVYSWSDRNLAFHYCKSCGCITHFEAIKVKPPEVVAVNARMMVGLDPAGVRLRQIDNRHSGFFWTKSDEPVSLRAIRRCLGQPRRIGVERRQGHYRQAILRAVKRCKLLITRAAAARPPQRVFPAWGKLYPVCGEVHILSDDHGVVQICPSVGER